MLILARPLKSSQARLKYWREIIEQAGVDPLTQYVPPEEARVAPYLSVRARLSILLRAYSHDYHTDSFQFDRLARQVMDGTERISFWGDGDSVRVLRDWIERRQEPTDSELDRLALGTATILDVQDEFGDGYAEMCRTASRCRSVSATAPILFDLVQLLQDEEVKGFAAHHTFLSVPRNRISTGTIRGGTAIHRVHVREIQSSFWGVAPWYIMQGGYLEVLDYRELHREPVGVVSEFRKISSIHCSTEGEKNYLTALMKLNLSDGVELPSVQAEHSCGLHQVQWCVTACPTPELAAFNPIFIRPDPGGRFSTLQEAISFAESMAHACLTVFLPLDDPMFAGHQRWLNDLGYRLAAMSPPKSFMAGSALSAAKRTRTPCFGLWARPRHGAPLATPYYLDGRIDSFVEQQIIRYIRYICNAWNA